MAGTGKVKRRPNTEYITDKSARKACLNKRKKGLLKKLTEVTTLCDVEACAIVYNSNEEEPVMFTDKDVSKVTDVISKFKSLPEEEQIKNMLTQETFLREKIAKVEERLKKLRAENKEKTLSGLLCEWGRF
ncbi:hypothetical protein vseg_017425 [Gypsophila vaccaria]